MNRPTPDPAVVALARDVEQLRREVDQHRTAIDRAQETGDTAHRVLADLVDRVAAVADNRVAEEKGDDSQGLSVESWLSAPRPEAVQELVAWMDQVLIHYPGTADALGQCGPYTPGSSKNSSPCGLPGSRRTRATAPAAPRPSTGMSATDLAS